MAQGVLAGGAGAALEAREGDDVGAGLGDPEADRADVRHDGHLDRDAHVRVDRLQLVDQLGEVLDRVEVVVVGGRDQVGAGRGVTRGGDLLGDLLAGQVAALAGLRALADLDLGDVGGVDHLRRDAEAARGDLLAAPFAVLPVHVADLAALAVDAEHVDRLRRLGVGAEGRLGLRAEAHRGDHDRVVVVADAGVDDRCVRQGLAVAHQPHDVAHRDRALGLQVAHLLAVFGVAAGAVGGGDRRLVDLGVEAERLRRFGALLVAAEDARPLVGARVEAGEADAALLGGGEGLGLEDLGQLGPHADRGELARVAAHLVDADRRDHFLDPLGQRCAEVADVLAVVLDADHLDHRVRADAVGAEAERQHRVVDVADRRRAQDDAAAAAQVLLARLDPELLQRLVDGGDREVRVEEATLGVVDGAVGQHQQLGAVADPLHRLLLDPLDRTLARLRLEQRDVDGAGAAAELLPEVLQQVGLALARDLPVGLVGERRHPVMAAEDHREGGLDRARVLARGVDRGAAAEDRAGREVLHLTLAVDRRVGDDGDRLLEVVGEVLALRRERRQRPVVAQRADRLGPVGGHLLDQFDVVALPAEAGEDAVLDLDRLFRAGVGVARDVAALERAAGLQRPVIGTGLLGAVAGQPAVADDPQHLIVRAQGRAARLAVDRDHRLLARGERLRLGDHLGDGDDAGLGAEDEVLAGLHLPERPQAERVGGEGALVAVAGDQRHRALGERPHRLAQVHVEAVQVVGQRADLVDDRRHDHLHRLGEAEPVSADQRGDRPVEVLGVRGAGLDRHAEHPRLLAQLSDRVDLAVVAEHRERLHALERGPGVGRVAVVAEGADRLEALVAQVGVVLAEHVRRAHHLVDADRRRKRGDVDAELALELDQQVEEDAVAVRGVGDEAADLPEVGLLLARGRAEGGRVDDPEALGEDAEAAGAEDLARVVLDLLQVLRAFDEDVGDGEGVVEGQRGVVAAAADLLGPDLARDVDQQAAAVALAVDVAGAVEHLLQRRDRAFDRFMARRRVLAHRGVDRAGVLVLDAGRRNERPIGTLWRVADGAPPSP